MSDAQILLLRFWSCIWRFRIWIFDGDKKVASRASQIDFVVGSPITIRIVSSDRDEIIRLIISWSRLINRRYVCRIDNILFAIFACHMRERAYITSIYVTKKLLFSKKQTNLWFPKIKFVYDNFMKIKWWALLRGERDGLLAWAMVDI